MNILVIGKGGREHAIVNALSSSKKIENIYALPGSIGISNLAKCIDDIELSNHSDIADFCNNNSIKYVLIGPEGPLVEGLGSFLREQGLYVFGPNKEGAFLEGSKVFSKQFMKSAGIPTSPSFIVTSVNQAIEIASSSMEAPYVFKADGLAGGKGVYICKSIEDLKLAATDVFEKKIFGDASERALLENFEEGYELSYFVLTNGKEWTSMPLAQDHKKIFENEEGPNTGGMGTIAPLEIDQELINLIESDIVAPTIAEFQKRDYIYNGVVFIGLMITKDGPKVLEYNVRFGDPETQVLLPLLDGDWGEVFCQISQGELPELKWKNMHTACVVAAAKGYPENPIKGDVIEGDLASIDDSSCYVLHAGTKKNSEGKYITNGGRVLNIVCSDTDREKALLNCYKKLEDIHWTGIQYRKDIGQKSLKI